MAGHGVNLQGLPFVQPLGLASYQAALPRLSALFAAHSVLVAGSGGHGGVTIPSAEEYALKKGFLSSAGGTAARVQEDTVDLVTTDGEDMPVPGRQPEIRMHSDGQQGTCRDVLRCFALQFEVACERGCFKLNCTLPPEPSPGRTESLKRGHVCLSAIEPHVEGTRPDGVPVGESGPGFSAKRHMMAAHDSEPVTDEGDR